jgi:hypothetical protein
VEPIALADRLATGGKFKGKDGNSNAEG